MRKTDKNIMLINVSRYDGKSIRKLRVLKGRYSIVLNKF